MWNGRFSATSGDPFSNSLGFHFPPPEGDGRSVANDPVVTYLLIAQAHLPPTELVEVAGFTGTAETIGPRFDIFDDAEGEIVPRPDRSGFRNEPIRQAVLGASKRKPDVPNAVQPAVPIYGGRSRHRFLDVRACHR
jgi:cytochrome c peroxidase